VGVDHAIDAGRGRRELGVIGDDGAAERERTGAGRRLGRHVLLRQSLLLVLLEELGRRVDVALGSGHACEGKVSGRRRPVVADASVEAMALGGGEVEGKVRRGGSDRRRPSEAGPSTSINSLFTMRSKSK